MFYIHYEDRGPSGPGGQDCRSTNPWNKLFVFESREAAQPFIESVVHQMHMPGRIFPWVVNTWDDDLGDVVHQRTEDER